MVKYAAVKIHKFFAEYKLKDYNRTEIVVAAGKAPGGVIYLANGYIRQYDIAPNGQKITLNIFKPGTFFPMSWAINGTENRYFFEAMGKCQARIAPVEHTVKFLKANPDVLFDLLARVYKGTDGLIARQAGLMAGGAGDRLATELSIYAQRFGRFEGEGCVIKLKDTELASLTGLTRETVSRQIQKLIKSGLIERKSDQIIIIDMNKLAEKSN